MRGSAEVVVIVIAIVVVAGIGTCAGGMVLSRIPWVACIIPPILHSISRPAFPSSSSSNQHRFFVLSFDSSFRNYRPRFPPQQANVARKELLLFLLLSLSLSLSLSHKLRLLLVISSPSLRMKQQLLSAACGICDRHDSREVGVAVAERGDRGR